MRDCALNSVPTLAELRRHSARFRFTRERCVHQTVLIPSESRDVQVIEVETRIIYTFNNPLQCLKALAA